MYFCFKIMIQRIQSLFLFLYSISCLILVFYFPILENNSRTYFLVVDYPVLQLLILLSATSSFIAIFQFKRMKRQLLISLFSRVLITISLLLIIFLFKEDKEFSNGLFFMIVPFIFLVLATYFIKRDNISYFKMLL